MKFLREYPWRGRAAVGVVAGLLALCGWQTLRAAFSAVYLDSARTEWEDIELSGKNLPGDIEERIARYLWESLRYQPDNPQALETAGYFQTKTRRDIGDSMDRLAALRGAKGYFREVVRLQPTAPEAWAHYAQSKLYLGEIDNEMFRALTNADALGSWDSRTQRIVLAVSLSAWDKLPGERRAAALRTLERAMYRDPRGTVLLLRQRRKTDLLCKSGIRSTRIDMEELCASPRQPSR